MAKYDRKKVWENQRKKESNAAFDKGVHAGRNEYRVSMMEAKNHTFMKGYRKGIKITKSNKLKALVSGKPNPDDSWRFYFPGTTVRRASFRKNMTSSRPTSISCDDWLDSVKYISNAIDEDLINQTLGEKDDEQT